MYVCRLHNIVLQVQQTLWTWFANAQTGLRIYSIRWNFQISELQLPEQAWEFILKIESTHCTWNVLCCQRTYPLSITCLPTRLIYVRRTSCISLCYDGLHSVMPLFSIVNAGAPQTQMWKISRYSVHLQGKATSASSLRASQSKLLQFDQFLRTCFHNFCKLSPHISSHHIACTVIKLNHKICEMYWMWSSNS